MSFNVESSTLILQVSCNEYFLTQPNKHILNDELKLHIFRKTSIWH